MTGGEIAIVVAAVVVGSLVKSITGFGLPLLAIPIMSLFVSTETAVAVIAVPNVLQNMTMSWRYRSSLHDSPGLALFCGAGMAGAVLGTFSLGAIPEWCTQVALLGVVGGFVVTNALHSEFRFGAATVRRWNAPVGFVSGLFQGAIGISGPVVGTWYHGRRLAAETFVFSVSTVFFLTGLAQAIVLGVRGALDDHLGVMAALTVIVLTTIPLGQRLRSRLSSARFERLVLVLLTASCVSIVVDLL